MTVRTCYAVCSIQNRTRATRFTRQLLHSGVCNLRQVDCDTALLLKRPLNDNFQLVPFPRVCFYNKRFAAARERGYSRARVYFTRYIVLFNILYYSRVCLPEQTKTGRAS